jgi:enamine deaminase RidA (YjgF/YER057c/UK114 family)
LRDDIAVVYAAFCACLPFVRKIFLAMKKSLHPPNAPPDDIGYSPAIIAEGRRLVFVSGQGPRDLEADIETQIRQAFERIRTILTAAGASMDDIVILRSYFVHFSRDLPAYRKVRKEFLSPPYPASTAVGVTELAPAGNVIEIEAVAMVASRS